MSLSLYKSYTDGYSIANIIHWRCHHTTIVQTNLVLKKSYLHVHKFANGEKKSNYLISSPGKYQETAGPEVYILCHNSLPESKIQFCQSKEAIVHAYTLYMWVSLNSRKVLYFRLWNSTSDFKLSYVQSKVVDNDVLLLHYGLAS